MSVVELGHQAALFQSSSSHLFETLYVAPPPLLKPQDHCMTLLWVIALGRVRPQSFVLVEQVGQVFRGLFPVPVR